MSLSVLKEFVRPDSRYRGKPFWAWNGKLDPEELRRQVRLLKHMGLGGFFMHSRVGLDTAYLAKEWFQCIEACIDEARKQGMEAWLYDEDRWPSGAAGGLVTKNPTYRRRSMALEMVGNTKGGVRTDDTKAVFSARVEGNRVSGITRLRKGARTPTGQSILRFREKVDECTPWHNGFTYLDTLNHDAVREFIRVTYEAYREHTGQEFGATVPGIFTDEPNFGGVLRFGRQTIPWTASLSATFKKRYGYDIMAYLPYVFFDSDDPRALTTRYHYMECITFLFVDAFSRQIGEWCEQQGLRFTGHMLSEESLGSQSTVVGSTLRHYEYMQAPGMDLLTEYKREYDTAKQVSSVARQFGRQWRLTETYGCTGWDFPLEGHKALGDWQAALGINLRCQHLSWYTMLGQAKRDYPAGIFYQSPWWEHYAFVEDYFARIAAATTRGEEVRDVLVIHPIESMWLHVRKDWQKNPAVANLNNMIVSLLGTFGARLKGTALTLTEPPRTLALGNWVKQGLPFYSGSVGYTTRFSPKPRAGQRLLVQVPSYEGAAVRVLVDGVPAGTVGWEPNEVDITDVVTRPTVRLCVEVISHRRNSHGPLHMKTTRRRWTGPGQFVTRHGDWTDGYNLVPCGLTGAPVIVECSV